jgi:hypothetical protein
MKKKLKERNSRLQDQWVPQWIHKHVYHIYKNVIFIFSYILYHYPCSVFTLKKSV